MLDLCRHCPIAFGRLLCWGYAGIKLKFTDKAKSYKDSDLYPVDNFLPQALQQLDTP